MLAFHFSPLFGAGRCTILAVGDAPQLLTLGDGFLLCC
jgi:hypothetical protein